MRSSRTLLGVILLGGLLSALVAPPPGAPASAAGWAPASAAGWAPADRATIRPGVQMYTQGPQCTGNFVFTDRAGDVYVGYAAHCAGTGDPTETDGCESDSLPLGTKVRLAEGGSLAGGGTTVGWGVLAYSSWLTMQRLGTKHENACAHNDFALVRLYRRAAAEVNPTVPFWGGPVGLDTDGTAPGEDVFAYGNSSLRGGVAALAPKQGSSLGTTGNGWSHVVYTASPGVPGDSGSAFLDGAGRAVGTLSTVAIVPLAGSNGVGDLHRQLRFAQRRSGIAGLRLARGTEPFRPLL